MTHNATLVIGASSAIAQSAIQQLGTAALPGPVFAVSSQAQLQRYPPEVTWQQSDYSDASITATVAEVQAWLSRTHSQLARVLVFNGMLHSESIQPEKRIEQLSSEAFLQSMSVNALLPMRWLGALMPVLKEAADCRIAVLSARVGSISDNRLGGWYSYRAAKAALNMLLKTASVELARRAPGVKLIAFHPGTTDTALSAPFQANVPEGKLFTPDFVASRLLAILDERSPDGELDYLDWQGESIAF